MKGKKRYSEPSSDTKEDITFVEHDLPVKTVDLPPKVYVPPVSAEGTTQLSLW